MTTKKRDDMPLDEQGPKAWQYKRKGINNKRMGKHSPVIQIVMLGIEVQEFSQFRIVDTKKGKL